MNLVTNGILMVSAASLTLGAIHLTLGFRRRDRFIYLLFAVAAFGVAAYAMVERAMMLADQADEYAQLVRWGHVSVWFIFVPLALFIRVYLKTGRLWLLWAIVLTRTCALIVNFLSPVNLNFLAI